MDKNMISKWANFNLQFILVQFYNLANELKNKK